MQILDKALEAAKAGWGPTIRLIAILAAIAGVAVVVGDSGFQLLSGQPGGLCVVMSR